MQAGDRSMRDLEIAACRAARLHANAEAPI
jgi:hypothetical protein